MDGPHPVARGRGSRGARFFNDGSGRGRGQPRKQFWSTPHPSNGQPGGQLDPGGERWERGGHRGGGRGHVQRGRGATRVFPNASVRFNHQPVQPVDQGPVFGAEATYTETLEMDEEMSHHEEEHHAEEEIFKEEDLYTPPVIVEPELKTQEEREEFWRELVKAREAERKKAIAEGKLDDPMVPRRLEDALTIVGTCLDMCPRFERYRRERENNLFEWEVIPGTKRVDHNRAVKMYERASGDKIIPSDLRPPPVLKRTLNYLFHELLPRHTFSATHTFIRDRSRAVRNDFTIQHLSGRLAIECYDRCARFHILAIHLLRSDKEFNAYLETQQLSNTLQSLKEFYVEQRGKFQSPTELEMRVYYRLLHIRNQVERDDIPPDIASHPVFQLTTDFRLHVQKESAPISKNSPLKVSQAGMNIFGQLAAHLRQTGNVVMIYLVACILEQHFGPEAIDNIEAIRGEMSLEQIIDGAAEQPRSTIAEIQEGGEQQEEEEGEEEGYEGTEADMEEFIADLDAELANGDSIYDPPASSNQAVSKPIAPAPNAPPKFTPAPAFAGIVSNSSGFGNGSVFGGAVFGQPAPPQGSPFGSAPVSAFGTSFPAAPSAPTITPSVASPPKASTTQSFFPGFGQVVKPPAPAPAPAPHETSASTSYFSLNPNASSFTPPSFHGLPATKTTETAPSRKPGFPTAQSQPITTPPSSFSFPATGPQTPLLFSSRPSEGPGKAIAAATTSRKASTDSGALTSAANGPRLSAPPMLRIDTNTSSGSNSSAAPSPQLPAAPRPPPVPLPATPGGQLLSAHPSFSHLRPFSVSGSPINQGMLSPLIFNPSDSSGASTNKPFNNFTPLGTPMTTGLKRSDSDTSFLMLPPLLNGKGKEREISQPEQVETTPVPVQTQDAETQKEKPAQALKTEPTWRTDEDLDTEALRFERRSTVVKGYFKKWLKKVTDHAAWQEACRQGELYRSQLSLSQLSHRPSSSVDRKRRISAHVTGLNDSGSSPVKKRARKRASAEDRTPRTDEDLVKRLKQNQKENESRWAQGSFLEVIRKHVLDLDPATELEMPWHIWLSTNPDSSDATAIWLQTKFDVPDSGKWLSDKVFSIPLSSKAPSSPLKNFPGLLVFECTPLDDTSDDLEKKYRVLDDCARLRDIVKSFPSGRYFVPSLLVITWSADGETQQVSDFFEMVKKMVADSTLTSYVNFPMTVATKELDSKLKAGLSSLKLDLDGRLVSVLSTKGLFKIFEDAYDSFAEEWVENCGNLGYFHWGILGRVIDACIALLNQLSADAKELLGIAVRNTSLPAFHGEQLEDSEGAYDDADEWLNSLEVRNDAQLVATDLQSHRNIRQDFPAHIFLQHLFALSLANFERQAQLVTTHEHFPVLTAPLESKISRFKQVIRPHHLALLQVYNFAPRGSSKHSAFSVTSSQNGSPSPKRPRLSDSTALSYAEPQSVSSHTNGESRNYTPSPTISLASLTPAPAEGQQAMDEGQPPPSRPVTVAMLRALTKDLKRKYIKPSS